MLFQQRAVCNVCANTCSCAALTSSLIAPHLKQFRSICNKFMILSPPAPRVIQTMTRSCLKRLQIMLTPLNPSISISMSAMFSSSFPQFIKQFCAAMYWQSRTWPQFGTPLSLVTKNCPPESFTAALKQARLLEHLKQHNLGRRAADQCQTLRARLLASGSPAEFLLYAALVLPLASTIFRTQ